MCKDHINKDPKILRTFEDKMSLEGAIQKTTSRFYFKGTGWCIPIESLQVNYDGCTVGDEREQMRELI